MAKKNSAYAAGKIFYRMYTEECMTLQEIANMTGTPRATVYGQIHKYIELTCNRSILDTFYNRRDTTMRSVAANLNAKKRKEGV